MIEFSYQYEQVLMKINNQQKNKIQTAIQYHG